MKNYYNILGISEDASTQVVNDAYKKLALKFHPDKNGGDPFYDHWFKEINEAKQILTNDDERAEYDFKLGNYADAYELIKQQQAQENYDRAHKRKRFVESKTRNKKFFAASGFVVVFAAIFFIFLEFSNDDINQQEKIGLIAKAETLKKAEDTPSVLAFTSENEPETAMEEDISEEKMVSELAEKYLAKSKKINNKPIEVPTNDQVQESKEELQLTDEFEMKERGLTDMEVTQILNLLKRENGKNCVQVVQSTSSDIKPDFAIALELKKHGYIIAGRELSSATKKGISVAKNGACTKLFIGTL